MARRLVPSLGLLLSLLALPAGAQQPNSPYRAFEPIVLTGEQISSLTGLAPEYLVGFRRQDNAWVQFPVQVDQRALIDVGKAYGPYVIANPDDCLSDRPDSKGEDRCRDLVGQVELVYWTDPNTWIGADSSDLNFDDDDELVFMARDTGSRARASTPAPEGTVGESRVEIRLTAPEGGRATYAYLFEQDGTLDPSGGTSYVSYISLFCDRSSNVYPPTNCDDSNPYLTTYDIGGLFDGPGGRTGNRPGANPENTTFVGGSYQLDFLDRWILDGLSINGSANLIDRQKLARPFEQGLKPCVRTERTASLAEGAFIVNRAGPIRALRAVIGANSGPLNQRHYLLYDQYYEQRFFQRVHKLDGATDFFDYSAAVDGSGVYTNNLITGWVEIDGEGGSDEVNGRGELKWEAVRGTFGTIITQFDTLYQELDRSTNPPTPIPATIATTNYYEDDETNPSLAPICTGDDDAIGASGFRFPGHVPNTDPRPLDNGMPRDSLFQLELGRRTALSGSSLSDTQVATARELLGNSLRLRVTVNPTGLAGDDPTARANAASAFETRLLPPRPNPADGRTVVPFELEAEGVARLALYDVLGREVAVLHDGRLPAGPHRAALDAAALPPGLYLVRLATAAGVQTQAVTVLGGHHTSR